MQRQAPISILDRGHQLRRGTLRGNLSPPATQLAPIKASWSRCGKTRCLTARFPGIYTFAFADTGQLRVRPVLIVWSDAKAVCSGSALAVVSKPNSSIAVSIKRWNSRTGSVQLNDRSFRSRRLYSFCFQILTGTSFRRYICIPLPIKYLSNLRGRWGLWASEISTLSTTDCRDIEVGGSRRSLTARLEGAQRFL